MNSFSDLQDIDPRLMVVLHLVPIVHNGAPGASVELGRDLVFDGDLYEPITIAHSVPALHSFKIAVTMRNKKYHPEKETAIMVKSLTVDGVDLLGDLVHHFHYQNDHGDRVITTYLGWNGTWALTSHRPFYPWLHQAQGQGWLLDFTA